MQSLFQFVAALILSAPNPVLPGVADAGVFRYAGQFYVMGVGTSGGMHQSADLLKWSERVHVFSMKNEWATGPAGADSEIHACDILLHGGTFHLYWSVNHGELRQIGHAVSSAPLGPYVERDPAQPFDGRIDPQCFVDEDGSLYFYTVKFGLGNIIYGQQMRSPYTLVGEATRLLWGTWGTWEGLDRVNGMPAPTVNEGPFTIKHRDRYYMMYNANHTDPVFGNYGLGVTESAKPLNFSNAGKYKFPVLRSNRDKIYVNDPRAMDIPEVKNCGQPNLVRGPNGFEWWLVYFADHHPRSLCIDRIHFFGEELFVEGPSTAESKGYSLVPSKPSFSDSFDAPGTHTSAWSDTDNCKVESGFLRMDGTAAHAVATHKQAIHGPFLLECWYDSGESRDGRYGIRFEDAESEAKLELLIDQQARSIDWHVPNNSEITSRTQLQRPELFAPGPHFLRVEYNSGRILAWIDGVALPTLEALSVADRPLVVSVFADDGVLRLDQAQYTRGWDEWRKGMRGWLRNGSEREAISDQGLRLDQGVRVQKGSLIEQYEFSAQVIPDEQAHLWPVSIDERNFLELRVTSTNLMLQAVSDGEVISSGEFELPIRLQRGHPVETSGINVRIVKLADRCILYTEGLEMMQFRHDWPASRVALGSGKGTTLYPATTLHELPGR